MAMENSSSTPSRFTTTACWIFSPRLCWSPTLQTLTTTAGVLFTPQRLSSFMQELDSHDIDLHLHASGDRATRNILDAVEQAQERVGSAYENRGHDKSPVPGCRQ